MADNSQYSERYVMALYYAYGRSDANPDAGRTSRVEPMPFAEWYMAQWAEFTNGECSHMPSVQDAWDTFRRSLV